MDGTSASLLCLAVLITLASAAVSSGGQNVPEWVVDSEHAKNSGHDKAPPSGFHPLQWSGSRGTLVPVDLNDGMDDERPKKLVRLAALPSPNTAARFELAVDAPKGAVRVFKRNPANQWERVESGHQWSAKEDAVFALTAARFAAPDWDGVFRLRASLSTDSPLEPGDGPAPASVIALRTAPFVIASSPQTAEWVFVRAYPGRNDAMVEDLERIVTRAGAQLHVVPGEAPYPAHHIWLQDAVEFGHAWTGQSDTPPFALPSNRGRDVDRFAETRLKEAGIDVLSVGQYRPAFAAGDGGDTWIDWYGNLEASPPSPGYPFGRIIYGVNPDTGAPTQPRGGRFSRGTGGAVPDPV